MKKELLSNEQKETRIQFFEKFSASPTAKKKKKKSERERERCSTEDAESVTDHFEEEGRLDINHGPNHHQTEARNRDGITRRNTASWD